MQKRHEVWPPSSDFFFSKVDTTQKNLNLNKGFVTFNDLAAANPSFNFDENPDEKWGLC